MDYTASTDELASALSAYVYLTTTPKNSKKAKPSKSEKKEISKTVKKEAVSSNKGPGTTPTKQAKYDRWSLRDKNEIDYGYFGPTTKPGDSGGFYMTTAINYTNGPAHMGHAYEATTSDVLARFRRVHGERSCYFVTGADEHGQKIANTAEGEGKEPIEICNKYVTGFQCLNQRLLISNDDYVRTTSERHKRTARELWKMCAANGDIYLDAYSGWYNVREETFVTDSDAALSDYKDPTSGVPLKQVKEESYFFKMSAYHERLVKYIEENPEFICPESHRNQILARLRADALRDLSISRTSFSWGIRVPEGFGQNHVMYVWVDALSNYLTGVDALGVNDPAAPNEGLAKFWPADVHDIGKDIIWFHTVIWPCLLMSAKIPLPKTIFAHGFVNDKEGKKMSKSLGNVVDPHDVLDKVPVDSFRWYLCKEAPYGGELAFNEDSLTGMHNSDLCDTLGNLVHRATNLCKKYCGGIVPDVPPPKSPPIDFGKFRDEYVKKMSSFELEGGAHVAMQAYRDVNGFLTEQAPWHMKGEENAEARQIVVRATLESVFALAHFLTPFIPNGAASIFKKLNTEPSTLVNLRTDLRNLQTGTKIDVGDVLYAKLSSEEEAEKKPVISHEKAQQLKKEKKAKEIAASKAGNKAAGDKDQPEFTKIDIRVGKIVKVWHHPDADKLFCEEIDLGEESGPRQIASGLREHYTLEEMQDRRVLVVCNLKPAKIVGFTSNGMVLAAKGEGKVELVAPPAESAIGERVFIEGLSGEPLSAAQIKKKKVWETVAKDLKTGENGVATWGGKSIATSAGFCAVTTLIGAPIS